MEIKEINNNMVALFGLGGSSASTVSKSDDFAAMVRPERDEVNNRKDGVVEGAKIKSPLKAEEENIASAAPASIEEDSDLDVSMLSAFAHVSFVNPETGEAVEMSGEELLNKINNGEFPFFNAENFVLTPIQSVGLEKSATVAFGVGEKPFYQPLLDSPKEGGVSIEGMDLEQELVVLEGDVVSGETLSSELVESGMDVKKAQVQGVKVDVKVVEEEAAKPLSGSLIADTKAVDAAIAADGANKNFPKSDTSLKPASTFDANHSSSPTASGVLADSPSAEVDAEAIPQVAVLNRAEVIVSPKAETDNSFREVYKGLGKEVIDQIEVNITKSAVKGVDKINIQLKPQELGSLEVKLQISKDGKIQAHIIASKADTAELIQRDAVSLERALSNAGFNLSEGSLSFSFREEQMAKNQNNLRDFIGNVLDNEEDLTNVNLFQADAWDGKSALNIRV